MVSVTLPVSARATSLQSVYDECESILTARGARVALRYLVDALSGVRAGLGRAEWHAAVIEGRQHPLFSTLCEDPYTAQAFAKPRGYPGDAATLDFVYRYRAPDEGTTRQGYDLHAVSTDALIARAVRSRCGHVAAMIEDIANSRPNAVVLSIACGHMRELHQVPPAASAGVSFVCLDQDDLSLAALPCLHPIIHITPLETTVRSLLTAHATVPRADLIYAAGLFDYLEARTAVALATQLSYALKPGGILLIPNLTPANEEVAYMEAIMDWWMTYRDESEMHALGRAVTTGQAGVGFTTYTTSSARIAWLQMLRT